MAKRSAVGPTLSVAAIWWAITAYFAPTFKVSAIVNTASIVILGCLFGGLAALLTIVIMRSGYRGLTAPGELRGLRSTIGEVPCPMPEPPRAEMMPAVSPLTVPDIPADFVDNWLDEYSRQYPEHGDLFKALLLVLNHRPNLPATHVAGGHGGRTLLQHSLLTSYVMTEVARSWRYEGLRDRTGKRVILSLRDPEYRFNSHDPMVAIIGLAHDIGKIDAFIYDHRGHVTGIRSEHDMTGARMIARMPEAWEIPKEDRDAMFLAIAHYHHPIELPLSPDKRAVDDRTIALMELLIRADFTVSKIEYDGTVPEEDEYRALDKVRSISAEQLYDEFVALLHEANRINSGNTRYSIGQVSPSPDGKQPMLYLHEESLRHHLMRKLGLKETPQLGNGKYQITDELLHVLHSKGLLYTKHDGNTFGPGNAMWVCDVLGSKGQKVAGWPCVIAVHLHKFDKLSQLGFYSSSIKILHSRFGDHQARRKATRTDGESVFIASPGRVTDIPDAPAKPAKKKEAKPRVQANSEAREPIAPVTPVNLPPDTSSAPAAQVIPAQAETTPEASEHDAPVIQESSADTPVVNDAPAPVDIDPPAQAPEGVPSTRIALTLEKVVDMGRSGLVKCKAGEGCLVFNLDTLLNMPMLAADLRTEGTLEALASDQVAGAKLIKMNETTTLLAISPPILK